MRQISDVWESMKFMEILALVAHDEKKNELLEWVKNNRKKLKQFKLIGTGSTADLVNNILDLDVEAFGHGPQGGDILLAAKILEDQVNRIVFFMDPHTPHSHEHDIQTLTSPRERGVVRGLEVEAHQAEQRNQEPFGLTKW